MRDNALEKDTRETAVMREHGGVMEMSTVMSTTVVDIIVDTTRITHFHLMTTTMDEVVMAEAAIIMTQEETLEMRCVIKTFLL